MLNFSTAVVILVSMAFIAGILVLLKTKTMRRTKTSLVQVFNFHNFKIEGCFMATIIPLKDFAQTTFKIKNDEDGSILDTIANAITFANETFSGNDESIAIVKVDPADGPDTALLDVQGIGEGTTSIKFEIDGSYIDPKILAANPGDDPASLPKVTKHFAASIDVTVKAGDTGTSLVVELGEPQPIPTV